MYILGEYTKEIQTDTTWYEAPIMYATVPPEFCHRSILLQNGENKLD